MLRRISTARRDDLNLRRSSKMRGANFINLACLGTCRNAQCLWHSSRWRASCEIFIQNMARW
ncbi:hypothetical protein [uncultured Campylobacter sp.]|uniref:hypothetical protein n=1 Tax=uncultured Campylobacter sp. TaxID=218934 RepID=UPI00263385FC|nr:hypothetical protein [uncultured Campylobacter sp.]